MSSQVVLNSDPQPDELSNQSDALNTIQNTFDKLFGAAQVESVYGDPIKQDDTIVIPAAEIVAVMGFGIGSGKGKGEASSGGGGGGGGSVRSRPVAAIVIAPNRVRIKPIVDVTKLALAALTTAGFMIWMVARMNSKRAPRYE